MKKVFIIGLIALLAACQRESITSADHRKDLQVNLSMSSISTRAIDESVLDQNGNGYILPFDKVKTLKIELYAKLEDAPIFTHEATPTEIGEINVVPTGTLAKLTIASVPVETRYVKVLINEFTTVNPDINNLQATNIDDIPVSTLTREEIPYEGVSEVIAASSESANELVVVKALVSVAPTLSRFEVHYGEINIVPASDYKLDLVEGAEGRAKVKGVGFTEEEILTAEESARINFKKRFGIEPSANTKFYYSILPQETVELPYLEWIREAYMNFFKKYRDASQLEMSTNDGKWSWELDHGYETDRAYSNMFTPYWDFNYNDGSVIAFNLFPQAAPIGATREEIQSAMPHLILSFSNNVTRKIYGNPNRWLTMRLFSNKKDGKLITEFKPGYCYVLRTSDITVTPYNLHFNVRISDADVDYADSDVIIKSIDQTAAVPEASNVNVAFSLDVKAWNEKDITIIL